MDLQQASEIIEAAPYAGRKSNTVAGGFALLAKYGELEVSAEHDVIYVGHQGKTLEEIVGTMAEEDIRALAALHWRIDEEYECWARFV